MTERDGMDDAVRNEMSLVVATPEGDALGGAACQGDAHGDGCRRDEVVANLELAIFPCGRSRDRTYGFIRVKNVLGYSRNHAQRVFSRFTRGRVARKAPRGRSRGTLRGTPQPDEAAPPWRPWPGHARHNQTPARPRTGRRLAPYATADAPWPIRGSTMRTSVLVEGARS